MSEIKYYIVWEGVKPGIYTDWASCKAQVVGYPNAKYKSFKGITREEAELLFRSPPEKSAKKSSRKKTIVSDKSGIIPNAVAVDASTRRNPGPMEYRGVIVETCDLVFASKVYPLGTNNIGEFLAIVHAMAWMKQQNYFVPIYSDSVNAIEWVRKGMCKTKLPRNPETEELFQHIERAVAWLRCNDIGRYQILKWDTDRWGEIPADYGRK